VPNHGWSLFSRDHLRGGRPHRRRLLERKQERGVRIRTAERSRGGAAPRPATLEDVRKTQETQTQEVGRLTGEVKALDAQQLFS